MFGEMSIRRTPRTESEIPERNQMEVPWILLLLERNARPSNPFSHPLEVAEIFSIQKTGSFNGLTRPTRGLGPSGESPL